MVLEATMICVDNSEFMRNGDYAPTRMQAQSDAVNLLTGAKTQQNAENAVGVLTMGGASPRVLVTLTPDLGKVLSAMHGLPLEGECNFLSSVQVAQIVLKHRQNKNQRQRIVIFSGSPVHAEQEEMIKVGKKLKKNNVAVDVVLFGNSDESNTAKVQAFHEAVNNEGNSALVTIPPGVIVSDVLLSTPVFTGADGEGGSAFAASAAAGAGGSGGGGGFEFGVDPNLDPELALALRVSLEEERARQEAAQKTTNEAGGEPSKPTDATMADADKGPAQAPPTTGPAEMEVDEDALLKQALQMSLADQAGSSEGAEKTGAKEDVDMQEGGEDELAAALKLSVQEEEKKGDEGNMRKVIHDSGYVSSVLAGLKGVDPNDKAVKDAVESLSPNSKKKEKEDQDDKDKK